MSNNFEKLPPATPPEHGKPKRYRRKPDLEYHPERVAEISREYIKQIFSSPEFHRTLDESIAMVRKSLGYEMGFAMVKHAENDETWYSKPTGAASGYSGEADVGISEERLINRIKRERNIYPAKIGSLHFHRRAAEAFALSPSVKDGDLETSSVARLFNRDKFGYDIRPIELILTRSLGDDRYFVLAYQESPLFIMSEKRAMLRELDETLYDTNDQDEVLEEMRRYGYKVELFKTVKGESDGQHRFSPEDLEKLAVFAHVPRKIDPSEMKKHLE